MVYITFRNPIKELYNYPPAIQERVKSLAEYKDQIPKELSEINAEHSAPLYGDYLDDYQIGCVK